MKKGMTILLSIFLLVGCVSDDAQQSTTETNVTTKVDPEENSNRSTAEIENADETEIDVEESHTDTSVSKNDHLQDFIEFDTLAEHIDFEIYQGDIETDNKGNRIILFEDESGHKKYKSIFIKHDNRLKIVQFKNDGLIYNEILK